jgi:hypothetical protein
MTEDDKALLALEREWWKIPGSKEQAISERTGLSALGYYQRLNRLVDDPEAMAYDPGLIKRLTRLRERRPMGPPRWGTQAY